MEFRILGQLEVSAGGRRIEIGRTEQRALLAVLLLNAGEAISTERLIEGIWGDVPPVTADQFVRADVSQLRTLLGNGATIATRAPGYAIEVAEGAIDAQRFESLVADARRARTEQRPPTPSSPTRTPSRSGAATFSPTLPFTARPRSVRLAWRTCG